MSGLPSRDTPCHYCEERYTACFDHCQKPEFLAWRQEHRKIREARRRESSAWAYTAEAILKNRRVR